MSPDALNFTCQLVGERSVWLAVGPASIELLTVPREHAELVVSTSSGVSATEAIATARQTGRGLDDLLFEVDGTVSRHPPYDVQGIDPATAPVPGADLTVQHVKRDSLVGSVRYVEVFRDGDLVERAEGHAAGFDVYVENSMGGMLEFHLCGYDEAGFGGAFVRARSQSDLLLLASIYSHEALSRHLATHASTTLLATRLGYVLTDEMLANLDELAP